MKNIVIIGAGNVGTNLAIALKNVGYTILQVYSYTNESAEALANKIDSSYTIDSEKIEPNADIYFYCLKDDVLESSIYHVSNKNALHIHTSGSKPIDIFENHVINYGVFYPLQTFSKNKVLDFSEIALFIEANNTYSEEIIKGLGLKLGCKMYSINSDERLKLHISAVFACNFTNYMYDIASQLVKSTGLPFDVLKPLIAETADKINYLSPYEAQTGPAVRFDTSIINKHLSCLPNDSGKWKIYDLISKQIYNRHSKKS